MLTSLIQTHAAKALFMHCTILLIVAYELEPSQLFSTIVKNTFVQQPYYPIIYVL